MANEGGKQQRDQAHRGHHRCEPDRPGEHRVQPHQQENPRLDHGGRVQVGRHRRGRSHGVGQPEVERKLRAFGEAPHQNQPQRHGEVGMRLDVSGAGCQQLADGEGARHVAQQQEPPQHGQAAAAGHGQRLACTGTCIGAVAPVTHQQE
jgi:hypothetical protein